MLDQFFECGCALRDEDQGQTFTRAVLRRCLKHQREMKVCSWVAWARKYAPRQYANYRKDLGINRREDL